MLIQSHFIFYGNLLSLQKLKASPVMIVIQSLEKNNQKKKVEI